MANKLSDRLLALVGLDLDFSIDVSRAPFSQISKSLYLGIRPTTEHLATLQQAGITQVVSCLREQDAAKVAFLQQHFDSHFFPLHDGIHEDISTHLPLFFEAVTAAQNPQRRATTLVHCEVGISRSASFAVAYLMQQSRLPFYDAYCAVRAKRGGVLPNIGFASQLQQLEFNLQLSSPNQAQHSSLAKYLHEACTAPVDIDTLEDVLSRYDYNALKALQAIFGDEVPRVVQGVRI